jgi:hypothetical protein
VRRGRPAVPRNRRHHPSHRRKSRESKSRANGGMSSLMLHIAVAVGGVAACARGTRRMLNPSRPSSRGVVSSAVRCTLPRWN